MSRSLSANPYSPPRTADNAVPAPRSDRAHRGPSLYLALGGLAGAISAIPLIAAIPLTADPNPIGYLLILLGVPTGGIVYRVRSREWPTDQTVRGRQTRASLATLLLPGFIALMTGMRAQGFGMTIVGGLISASLVLGIFLAGLRRSPKLP